VEECVGVIVGDGSKEDVDTEAIVCRTFAAAVGNVWRTNWKGRCHGSETSK